MQTLTYHNDSDITQGVMINRAQARRGPSHEDIRDAVRSWAGADGQDVVTALIIEEYLAQGGDDITFPDDLCRKRQKLFRFLDNHFNSDRYRENVRHLTPAILAVLPLEFRNRLLPEDNIMARLARMEKETSEAKICRPAFTAEESRQSHQSEALTPCLIFQHPIWTMGTWCRRGTLTTP